MPDETRAAEDRPAMTGAPETGPDRRMAPRPLALHLLTAQATWTGLTAAWPLLKSGSMPWHPQVRDRARTLCTEISRVDDADLKAGIDRAARARLDAYLRGLELYRAHPFRRERAFADLGDPHTVADKGGIRLLDYGGGPGAPVLVVPSLINRYYILDLLPERSFLRSLADGGARVFAVDWGAPDAAAAHADLDWYIGGPLVDFCADIRAHTGGAPALIGYCMGGLLALGAAHLRPDLVRALALLAMPWDFHKGGAAHSAILRAARPLFDGVIQGIGVLPLDLIQAMFFGLDPFGASRKFERFSAMRQDGPEARAFVALEDWLNDGTALSGPVARTCLFEWYGENTPGRGVWRLGGRPVTPEKLRLPVLVAVPNRDRIVPPESARAFLDACPDAEMLDTAAGHIGMMVGSRARDGLYEPVLRWLYRTMSGNPPEFGRGKKESRK